VVVGGDDTTTFLSFSNETIGNGCITVAKRGNRQRFLTCCSVLTSCVLCFTKPLPIAFRPRFGKRGHQKPSPIPFRLRFKYVDNRRQSKSLQQSSF
jgi:hypothetical protein